MLETKFEICQRCGCQHCTPVTFQGPFICDACEKELGDNLPKARDAYKASREYGH